MPSGLIAERLDIVEDIGPRQVADFVDRIVDSALLQAIEEGFDHRVVPTVTTVARARLQVVQAPPSSSAMA